MWNCGKEHTEMNKNKSKYKKLKEKWPYKCHIHVANAKVLEEEMETSPVLLPGEPHGQRSLVGYSPWSQVPRVGHNLGTKPPFNYNSPL